MDAVGSGVVVEEGVLTGATTAGATGRCGSLSPEKPPCPVGRQKPSLMSYREPATQSGRRGAGGAQLAERPWQAKPEAHEAQEPAAGAAVAAGAWVCWSAVVAALGAATLASSRTTPKATVAAAGPL